VPSTTLGSAIPSTILGSANSIPLFRTLSLSPAQHVAFTARLHRPPSPPAFTARFGPRHFMQPLAITLPGHPEITTDPEIPSSPVSSPAPIRSPAESVAPADAHVRLTARIPAGDALVHHAAARAGAAIPAMRPQRLHLAAGGTDLQKVNAWPAHIGPINHLGAHLQVARHRPHNPQLVADAVNNNTFTFRQGEKVIVWFGPDDTWLIPG
jgi:hypothetical protein